MQFDRICPICLEKYNPVFQKHICREEREFDGDEEFPFGDEDEDVWDRILNFL